MYLYMTGSGITLNAQQSPLSVRTDENISLQGRRIP